MAISATAVREYAPAGSTAALRAQYRDVRNATERLCAPLATEDYVIQSMPEVSPPKWHLAHTSWFFENFLLVPLLANYRPFHPRYGYLFNSYYETVGTFHPRPRRGVLARPTVQEIYRYRACVDEHMARLIETASDDLWAPMVARLTLGLQHEQQHQELLLTDIKHIFASNPLQPCYREIASGPRRAAPPLQWLAYCGGLNEIGAGAESFAFDNEQPRHRVYLEDFRLASRPVTNGEYLDFIEQGGYSRPQLWLSEGWRTVKEQGWQAPLYWEQAEGRWWSMTLGGPRPVDEHEPVCHVSYFEADAYARWAGATLPSEAQWEIAARSLAPEGNFVECGRLQPAVAGEALPTQLFGDVWEWTQSAYTPYPGYRPLEGALGEYNGKFMCGQMVLRGGSCATPQSHIRATYRNFFYPADRWQFTGIRLAQRS